MDKEKFRNELLEYLNQFKDAVATDDDEFLQEVF